MNHHCWIHDIETRNHVVELTRVRNFRKPHPSRYTFLLCRHKTQDSPVGFDANSLRGQYEGEPGELGKAGQDLIDRWKFNTQHFIDRNDLVVIASTFMLVEGNLKSAVANAGLTAQAVADKMVGK